jgi:oxysterol-binding protein 1
MRKIIKFHAPHLSFFVSNTQDNSLMRILSVAAFAVSGYASTDGRSCKPFNPLLGETYEADYPDKGLRFFSEKVC